jgi:hypothetical protein
MENVSKTRKANASWDANASRIFNEICVDQVLANNRPWDCLNTKGYANLVASSMNGLVEITVMCKRKIDGML